MTTDFFWNLIKKIVTFCSIVFLSFGGVTAIKWSNCEYFTTHTLYFVGVNEGGVEACAHQVALDGGAGYLYKDKVLLSTYFSKEEAEKVKEAVEAKYPSASVLSLSSPMVLVSREKKVFVKGMLDNYYQHIQQVATIADDLEEGLTQEKAKSRLEGLDKSFKILAKTYSSVPTMYEVCESIGQWLQEQCQGVVYSKNIRYMVCEMAEGFYNLANLQYA